MKLQDFCDMDKFEEIMKNWANSTGLATVAVTFIGRCHQYVCPGKLCNDAESKSYLRNEGGNRPGCGTDCNSQ